MDELELSQGKGFPGVLQQRGSWFFLAAKAGLVSAGEVGAAGRAAHWHLPCPNTHSKLTTGIDVGHQVWEVFLCSSLFFGSVKLCIRGKNFNLDL